MPLPTKPSADLLRWLYSRDSFSNRTVGRAASDSIDRSICTVCGKDVAISGLVTDESRLTYLSQGWCIHCQKLQRNGPQVKPERVVVVRQWGAKGSK